MTPEETDNEIDSKPVVLKRPQLLSLQNTVHVASLVSSLAVVAAAFFAFRTLENWNTEASQRELVLETLQEDARDRTWERIAKIGKASDNPTSRFTAAADIKKAVLEGLTTSFYGEDFVVNGGDLSCLGEISIVADTVALNGVDLIGTNLIVRADHAFHVRDSSISDSTIHAVGSAQKDDLEVHFQRVGLRDSSLYTSRAGMLNLEQFHAVSMRDISVIYSDDVATTSISNSFFDRAAITLKGDARPLVFASGFLVFKVDEPILNYRASEDAPINDTIADFFHEDSSGSCVVEVLENGDLKNPPQQFEPSPGNSSCPKVFKTWTSNLDLSSELKRAADRGASKFLDLSTTRPDPIGECDFLFRMASEEDRSLTCQELFDAAYETMPSVDTLYGRDPDDPRRLTTDKGLRLIDLFRRIHIAVQEANTLEYRDTPVISLASLSVTESSVENFSKSCPKR